MTFPAHSPKGSGGDEGIRTLDGLMTHTPLAGERLRPLGHVSVGGTSELRETEQALIALRKQLFAFQKLSENAALKSTTSMSNKTGPEHRSCLTDFHTL